MIIALSIILTVAAVAIVILVISQNGKSHGLSGSIAGGAETFFGKESGKKADKILNRITTILAIAFCAVLIVLYLVQPDVDNVQTPDLGLGNSQYYDQSATTDTDAAETTAAPETDKTPETGAETDAPETAGAAVTTDAPATDAATTAA